MNEPIIVINGIRYDISGAAPAVSGLIQDLSIVQQELASLQIKQDITTIAKQTLLEKVAESIEAGTSGLVEIKDEEETPETEQEK